MPKAARPARSSLTKPGVITPSDAAILHALARYPHLSSFQVCRLLYSYPSSLSWVQAKLKRLVDLRFIQRVFLPRPSQFGSAPSLYVLARAGINFLAAQGQDVPRRYRPTDQQGSYLFLQHTLAVHDCLIALELLCQETSGLELRELRPERLLKREPAFVDDEDQRHLAVIPDAWVNLALQGTFEFPIAFEVDRGSEEQRRWRAKVRHLVAWSRAPYREKFGTTALTIAVVATPGAMRLHDLLRWTEAELTALGEAQEADLFRFVGVDPGTLSPVELFLAPHWLRPFDPAATPLFELAGPPSWPPGRPVLATLGV